MQIQNRIVKISLISFSFFILYFQNGFHADELILRYIHGEKDVIIDLKLNDNLIPEGHFMRYQSKNGSDVVQHFTKTDIDLCHYTVSKRYDYNTSSPS